MSTRFRFRFRNVNYELPVGEFIIGRASGCHLVLEDPRVSRRHVRVNVEASRATVEDLGSRNGVQINGVTLRGPMVLAHHDLLAIGSMELRMLIGVDRDTRASPEQYGTDPETTDDAVVKGGDGFPMQFVLLDKALRNHEFRDAEVIVGRFYAEAAKIAKTRALTDVELEPIGRATLLVANTTGRSAQIDALFAEYRRARVVMPKHLLDDALIVARRTRHPLSVQLREYADWIHGERERLNPVELRSAEQVDALIAALKDL